MEEQGRLIYIGPNIYPKEVRMGEMEVAEDTSSSRPTLSFGPSFT